MSAAHAAPVRVAVNALRLCGIARALCRTSAWYGAAARPHAVTYSAIFPIVVGLFLAMLACLEAGYRAGRRRMRIDAAGAHEGLGSVEAATFALLGLLLGFAFSGALARFDARRGLIVDEATAIGTAYQRLDLAPAEDQPGLRRLFREYLDARIGVYATPADEAATDRSIAAADSVQRHIWTAVIESSRRDQTQNVARVLVPAVNEMTGITTARAVALHTRLPVPILVLLLTVALSTAVIAGYSMSRHGRRSVLHAVLYAASIALTIYIVLDLDYPRRGLIRLETTDQILEQLRQSIR